MQQNDPACLLQSRPSQPRPISLSSAPFSSLRSSISSSSL
jgi:hypothetical protein